MPIYSKILVVVDLTETSQQVLARALQVAQGASPVTMTLMHVVEYVAVEPLNDSLLPAIQIEGELLERAKARLGTLAGTATGCTVAWKATTGNIKAEIIQEARAGHYDLVVIGSHERHGLSIVVNLTEDTILHAAPCDVLAVRLLPIVAK
jgi:universal stress protein A